MFEKLGPRLQNTVATQDKTGWQQLILAMLMWLENKTSKGFGSFPKYSF